MDPALWERLRTEEAIDPDRPIEAIIKLAEPEIDIPDVQVIAQFGPIATCRIPASGVHAVHAHPNVVSLKAARRLRPAWTSSLGPGRVPDSSKRLPTDVRRPAGLGIPTGAGVTIGSADWGIDWASDTWLKPSGPGGGGGTRFLAIWDQRDNARGRAPAPYGYGGIHTNAEIDAALHSPRPYETLGYHPATSDQGAGTHAQHVMDILCGNSKAGGPVGIAPEASLVFVHLADRDTGGLANLGDSVRLLEALHFIRQVAPLPAVINCSFGRTGGPHDGTSMWEQAIDWMLASTPGLVLVSSNGNYYRTRTHASATLAGGETRTLQFEVHPEDVTENELEVWYSGTDELEVTVTPPGGPAAGPVLLGQQSDLVVAGRRAGRIYHRRDPLNGDNHIDAFLSPAGLAGTWTVTLTGRKIRDGRFHAWLERDDSGRHSQARFTAANASRTTTTGTLANGHLNITVGAYNAHDPDHPAAPFSSAGPTRDLRDRPHLVAPGLAVLAARSAPATATTSAHMLTRKSGSSMAAPHVSGAAALALALSVQMSGRLLTAQEVRALLLTSCDPPVGPDPEHRLGAGYLNIPRLLAATRASLIGDAPHPQEPLMDADPANLLTTYPAVAYRELLYRPTGQIAQTITERYEVIARADTAGPVHPNAGDVLIQVQLGQPGSGLVTVIDKSHTEPHRGPARLRHGQLLLRPRQTSTSEEDTRGSGQAGDAGIGHLIDEGRSENQITDILFAARKAHQAGARQRAETPAAAREWLTIRETEVRPAVLRRLPTQPLNPLQLAVFFSQYEGVEDIPADLATRFQTGPPMLSLGRSLRDRVLANWLYGRAPLTPRRFHAFALDLAGDPAIALLLCHNVARAFVRSSKSISWDNGPSDGEYTTGDKTYHAHQRHPDGRVIRVYSKKKKRYVPSIFYVLFSATDFGTDDPGDWYHFFLTATMAATGAETAAGRTGSRLREAAVDDEEAGRDPSPVIYAAGYEQVVAAAVANVATLMMDPTQAGPPSYRGWLLANAVSFLEGGHYGGDYASDQSDVERESRAHLKGSTFGLRTKGMRTQPGWTWQVPLKDSITRADVAAAAALDVAAGTGLNVEATFSVKSRTWRVWDTNGKTLSGKETK